MSARDSTRGEAIVEATVRRARPVILTALAAILAMIPLSRSAFWGPMAITIMGGLFVATFLTLLFLPSLYALWYRKRLDERGGAEGEVTDTSDRMQWSGAGSLATRRQMTERLGCLNELRRPTTSKRMCGSKYSLPRSACFVRSATKRRR